MNKNRIRYFLFKFLDSLPSGVGFGIYHFIQKIFTESFEKKVQANQKTLERVQFILSEKGISLEGLSVLEIGSGWMPLMPYLLKEKAGVDKVYTYDLNDHYQNKYIDELNTHFLKKGLDLRVPETGLHIPDFVEYYPKANVITADLPQKVDLIFSRFVLEHVNPKDIVAMHKRFVEKYGNNVLIFHFISPSDHRAFSNSSLSHYDFLRYSQSEWDRIQTKFDYHNRLRLPQYLELFEEAGLNVSYLEYDYAEKGTKKYELFKKVPIHSDYTSYSDKELSAGSINVLLQSN